MTNHPEVYRVLTGSAVVKKVIGESASNYTLGGARTHGRHSGDIDIVCETEEEAIECARKLLKLFLTSDREYRHANEVSVSSDNTYDTINRETIVAATDDGTFFETRSMLKGTSSLLTGYGSKDNIPIGLAASLSNYGIRNARSFKKLYMLYAGCQEFGLPLVAIVRDRWHSITEGTLAKILYLRSECMGLFNTLTIPRITVAIGPRSLDESIHHIADICVYMRDGTESGYDINRSDSLTHLRAGNLSQCMTKISQLILYLLKKPFSVDFSPAERNLILPANSSEPYDIRLFMRELFDAGSFFELLERDEQPLVVGFATLNGTVVGVIADDPAVASGAQTVSSLGKFTRFNRLCERFSIPLIEFNDCPAFQPGSRQERLGIQGEGGKSIREECLGRIPRLAVTLRQNYGGRLIHANLKTLGPKRSALICQGARVGVMGPEGALDVLYGKKLMAMDEQEREKESARLLKEYVDQYLNPQKMIDLGYADSIVPLNRLREEIAKWVRELE
jgi:acetyl-CoA carboxylase carboxyltransferase component